MKKQLLIPKIIIIFIVIGAFLFNALEFLDLRVHDFLYQHKKPVNEDIIILGIDDESLLQLGKWPWERTVIADVIRMLTEGGAAAIGVDIIYSEKSPDSAQDEALVEAVRSDQTIIIPGYCVFYNDSETGKLSVDRIVEPFEELKNSSDFALLNVIPDNDGILRRAFLSIEDEGVKYQGFSYALYKKYCEFSGVEPLKVSEIPRDSYNRLWIDYGSGPGTFLSDEDWAHYEGFEHVSVSSVVNGEIPPEYFYGKIVLLGVTSMGVPDDYYFTSIAPESPMYGIEVHANVISQLISGEFYAYLSNMAQAILLLLVGLAVVLSAKLLRPAIYNLFVAGFTLSLFLVVHLLFRNGIFVNAVYYGILIVVEYLFTIIHRLIVVTKDRMRIQNMFGRYMATELVQQLVETDIEDLTLGGKTVNISVLFVDIRGFTTLSEGMEPETIVGILNIFLEMCSNAILNNRGIIDKYIGDCAMAIFNAPIEIEEHELAAVKTGWEMVNKTDEINEKIFEKFGVRIEYGVGVNTGVAVVGNIGSKFRMDYTAIGDTVNSASRLQGQSKGRQVLISESVYQKVKDEIVVDMVGEISVKGKHDLIKAYSVLGLKEAENDCSDENN